MDHGRCCFVCYLYTKVAVDTFYAFNGSRCESCCNCPQGSQNRDNCVTRPNKFCRDCIDQGHPKNGLTKGKKGEKKK